MKRRTTLIGLAWAAAAFYLGMGLIFFLKLPNLLAGVAYTSPNGLPAVQSVFAGLSIGVAAAIITLAWHRLYALAVLVGACVTAGLATARLYSMVTTATYTAEQWTHLTLEAAGVAVGLAFGRELHRELDHHRRRRRK